MRGRGPVLEGTRRCGTCSAHHAPGTHACPRAASPVPGPRTTAPRGTTSRTATPRTATASRAAPSRAAASSPTAPPTASFPPTAARAPAPAARGGGAGRAAHRAGRRPAPGTVRAVALGAVGLAVLAAAWLGPGEEEDGGPGRAADRPRPCPDTVAALLPGDAAASLVESFETERHRIVLCANDAGELSYFGEYLDGSADPVVVPALRTPDGYTAVSGRTRYEIVDGQVVVTGRGGAEIARHDLVEAPR